MALPANYSTRTVHGRWVGLDGEPLSGTVRFRSDPPLTSPSTATTIMPVLIDERLDANGEITVELPTTGDPDITPTGWTYQVTESLSGGTRRYSITVPEGTDTLELATLSPVEPVTEVTGFVQEIDRNQPGGFVGIDENGSIDLAAPRRMSSRPAPFDPFVQTPGGTNESVCVGRDGNTAYFLWMGGPSQWNDLYAADLEEGNYNPKGMPADANHFELALAGLRLVRLGGYVYGVFRDKNDTLFKVYRAAVTPNIADLFVWEGPLLTLRDGATCASYGIDSDGSTLLLGEYDNPVDGVGNPAASIYRTVDGITWVSVFTGGADTRHVHAVAFDTNAAGEAWATLGDGSGPIILHSTDSGATWSTVTSDPLWQSGQIDFAADHVLFASDRVGATADAYIRATGELRHASYNWHGAIPVPQRAMRATTFYDAETTSGSTTLTSATADFTAVDDNHPIRGQNIPASTTIASVTNSTTVELSQAATATASGGIFTVDRDRNEWFGLALYGAVDPDSGVYYCVANSGGDGNAMGLFALPYVGGPVTYLARVDHRDTEFSEARRLYLWDTVGNGKVARFGPWRVPLPTW